LSNPQRSRVAGPSGSGSVTRAMGDQVRGVLTEDILQDATTTLQRKLDDLQMQIEALAAALEEKPDYGLGKGDPAITRWELDRTLLERLEKRATSLERAISRAERGTYGTCVQCGSPIHPDRLEVLPDARLCIRCARAGEREMPVSAPGQRRGDD
jgi:DnaK suppressor protein